MRKQQMDEEMRRQHNKQCKAQANETVYNSKMNATIKQKQTANETKAEKEMAR